MFEGARYTPKGPYRPRVAGDGSVCQVAMVSRARSQVAACDTVAAAVKTAFLSFFNTTSQFLM